MEVQSLENFINCIEKLMLQCDETDYVQELAKQAFGNQLSEQNEKVLNLLIK